MLQHRWGCFFSSVLVHGRPPKLAIELCHGGFAVIVNGAPKLERAPAAFDPADQFGDKMLLRFDQREPVFGLDQKQRRKVLATDLLDLQRERRRIFLDQSKPPPKKRERFIGRQNRQQTKCGFELRIFLDRFGDQIRHPGRATRRSRPA